MHKLLVVVIPKTTIIYLMESPMWQELQEKDAVTHCEVCGKKIWKFWHISRGRGKDFPEMKKCAPCLFKHE